LGTQPGVALGLLWVYRYVASAAASTAASACASVMAAELAMAMPSVRAPLDFSAASPSASAALKPFGEASPATATTRRRATMPSGR
jgi:hypothetical protein